MYTYIDMSQRTKNSKNQESIQERSGAPGGIGGKSLNDVFFSPGNPLGPLWIPPGAHLGPTRVPPGTPKASGVPPTRDEHRPVPTRPTRTVPNRPFLMKINQNLITLMKICIFVILFNFFKSLYFFNKYFYFFNSF